jgi:hypothetical protein
VSTQYLPFSDLSPKSCDISVSLGHDEPPIRHAFIENNQRTNTSNIMAGLPGGYPVVNGAFTYTNVHSTMTQTAEDKVCRTVKSSDLVVELSFSLRLFGWPNLKLQSKVLIVTAH